MKITRSQQLAIIDKITADTGLRSLVRLRLVGKTKSQRKAWRRERVQFLVDFVAVRANAGIVNMDDFKPHAKQAFAEKFGDEQFGSALLMFLAFQMIWWLIQKYLLNRSP
jgi:hypothetical protein